MSSFRQLAARSLFLVLVGLTAGWLYNTARDEPLALAAYEPAAASCEVAPETAPIIAAPAVIAAQCGGGDGVLFIDTRAREAFARGHVAGATHLPCSATQLQAEELLHLAGPRKLIVVYGAETADGLDVARSLNAQAPTLQTFVIEGGFAAWQNAALACASGPCERCNEETSHAH